jgi:ATP synthase protein I
VWRQFRLIFAFQAAATIAMALLSGWLAGSDGAVSALLGGLVSIIAGLGFALMVANKKNRSAEGVLRDAFRAESVKIVLVIMLLWLVFKVYEGVVAAALIGAFCITILIFGMALFVPGTKAPTKEN